MRGNRWWPDGLGWLYAAMIVAGLLVWGAVPVVMATNKWPEVADGSGLQMLLMCLGGLGGLLVGPPLANMVLWRIDN